MFRNVTNKSLAKIAVYGAFGCITAVMVLRNQTQERIRKTEYYREAFKLLRNHKGAAYLLGEPIKDAGFDLGDSERNFCDGKTAKFEISVKGPKERGKMYFWASRNDTIWEIERIELQLKKDKEKRLLVHNIIDNENI